MVVPQPTRKWSFSLSQSIKSTRVKPQRFRLRRKVPESRCRVCPCDLSPEKFHVPVAPVCNLQDPVLWASYLARCWTRRSKMFACGSMFHEPRCPWWGPSQGRKPSWSWSRWIRTLTWEMVLFTFRETIGNQDFWSLLWLYQLWTHPFLDI